MLSVEEAVRILEETAAAKERDAFTLGAGHQYREIAVLLYGLAQQGKLLSGRLRAAEARLERKVARNSQ